MQSYSYTLPTGYTALQALVGGATNAAYIVITGLSAVDYPRLRVRASSITTTGSQAYLACMYAYSALSVAVLTYYGVRSSKGTVFSTISCTASTEHEVEVYEEIIANARYHQKMWMDDTVVKEATTSATPSKKNYTSLGLFCALNGNAYYASYSARLTSATIYQCQVEDKAGNLKLDLHPCLDADGTPCMYDAVNGNTYYNAGSGTFGTIAIE